jgi:hypothetical protein
MPQELYADSQIKQVRFTKAEITQILLENFKLRAGTPYDFDYDRPFVLNTEDGGMIFRFVQTKITASEKDREKYSNWKPLRGDLDAVRVENAELSKKHQ